MRTQSTTIAVADYCLGLDRHEFIVNPNYQRSDTVWPIAAKSFLIETILLDYPVPKLSLHQHLELPTRTVVKEIVDGQQRSRAILDFYHDNLRLSRTILNDEFAGRKMSELPEDTQAQFLNYGLNFDLFVGATADEVREVFRRMNSFTVPLNPEEARHATYQGPFKWFVHQLSRDYDRVFQNCGVFSEKQVNRMADAKLLTEMAHALIHGISTTSRTSLDKLYQDFDRTFPQEENVRLALRSGLDEVLAREAVCGTPLSKPYNIYSLVLASIQAAGIMSIAHDIDIPDVSLFRSGEPEYNLSLLANALNVAEERGELEDGGDVDEEAGPEPPLNQLDPFEEFVAAASERTNVSSQRKRRFEFFLAALSA